MSDLSRSRIYFDEVRVSGLRLQHKIESMRPGEFEPASHLFGSRGHFLVVDHTQDGGVPGRTHFIDNFKMETGQDRAVPTSDGAGCFAPLDKCLGTYDRATTRQRRPNQR